MFSAHIFHLRSARQARLGSIATTPSSALGRKEHSIIEVARADNREHVPIIEVARADNRRRPIIADLR